MLMLKQTKTFDRIFSFIDQSHSFNSDILDRQISPAQIMIHEKWKFYEFLVHGIKKL